MSKRLMSVSLLLGMVAISAFVIISGCSSQNPTGPISGAPSDLTKITPAIAPSLAVIDISELISPAHTDTIQILRNTSIDNFIIPAGALDELTNIEVRSYGDYIGTRKVLVYEFGPEGLVFNSATHLNVDITKLKALARTASLYYFDPNINDWVYQGSVAVNGGRVDFSIYHFSKYAIE